MADLSTTYLGCELANPLVVAACPLSGHVDQLQLAERFGVGAVVMRSLFEEQILADKAQLEETLDTGAESFAEATDYFPPIRHADASDYLKLLEKARAAVQIPLIGSVNAVHPGSWVPYAKQIEGTGMAALELNVYAVAAETNRSGADLEQELFDLVQEVVEAVSIPVSVKLSPFYTSIVNVVSEVAKRGAKGVVLFNRFLQPDIDPSRESLSHDMSLSAAGEMRLPLRYAALCSGRVETEVAVSSGVHSGEDMVRALLAGAQVVQVAAALLKNGIHHAGTMLRDLEAWMDERGYDSPDDFRGKLDQRNVADPFAFERAQYVGLLMSGQSMGALNTRIS